MKKTTSHVVSLFAALILAAIPSSLQATPYASCVTNNNGTIQFYINEPGGNVVVTYEDGSTNANFNGITTGVGVAAGQQSFALNAPTHSSYSITVTKVGSGSPTVITTLGLAGNPRGVDVNKNTSSPYFGRVYEVNGGGSPAGVYLLNPDLSYAFTNVARAGGVTTFGSGGTGPGQSPYRLSVAADDSVIVGDATTGGAAVYQIDPNFTTNTLLLGPVGNTAGLAAGSHGTIESRPLLIGTTNAGNAVLYQIDGELTPVNSLQVYNIGFGPEPWVTAPSYTGATVGVGVDSIGLGGNEYCGLTRGPGPNHYLYCSTYRNNLSNPLIQVYDSTGVTNLWNSWQPDQTAYPGGTPTGDYFETSIAGITQATIDSAISADGNWLVAVNINNGVLICAVTNGIPNPASIFTVANPAGTTGNTRGIAWDAALNFYLSSSGLGAVQEWSLGVSATAVTQGNVTGQTNFSLTLPSTQVSVTATTPFASQNGPTPGVFTITRSSAVSSDTNSAQTVFFTLTGTATNGTPLLTTNSSSSVVGGVNVTNITITSYVPSNGVYTLSGELLTNVTTTATNTFTTTNGVTITTNKIITARTTYTATLSVVFAPGQDSTNITVIPVVDNQPRPTTTVILTLQGSGNYTLVPPLKDTVYIQNTGPEAIFISSVSAPSMYKGLTNDFGSFILTRYGDTNDSGNSITVANFTYAGTAVSNVAYVPAQPVVFAPGVVSLTNTVSPLIDTTNYVGNKTVIVTLASGAGYAIYSNNPVTLTILDNANLPATLIWSNSLTDPNDATNWGITSANNYMQSVTTPDNTIEFGYDLTANNPESVNNGLIPLPPSGVTNCLRVTLNKNSGQAAGVNLYPTNVTFSGDYVVRFDMNIAEGNNGNATTEGPLYGINHVGIFTNWWTGSGLKSGWDPSNTTSNWSSDGVWYWVSADGDASLGDFVEFTGVGGTNYNTGWQNPASGNQTSYVNIFKDPVPYSTTFGGVPSTGLPANSSPFNAASAGNGYTNAWANVEIKTVKKLVTMSINKTVIFSYNNTTVWTNGTLMLGYNDPFESIGGVDGAAYFSNIRVVRLLAPVFTLQPTNTVVAVGGTATFAVALTFDPSSANTNGQWNFNGTPVAGATNYVYSFTVKAGNFGNYSFTVNDGNYTVTSTNGALIPPTPSIVSVLPATRAGAPGGSANFTVTPLTFSGVTNYQWLSNSVPISGATAKTVTLNNLQPGNFGSHYTVSVNDGTTSVTSTPPVTITVAVPQMITSPGLTGRTFGFSFNSEFGPSYVVDSKTNLLQANWIPVMTNAGTGGSISVNNIVATNSQVFYRLRLQ